MRTAQVLLVVAAAVFLGIGVLYTGWPTQVGAIFPEPYRGTADARTEVRAIFGGVELAIGIFFALGVARASLRAPAVLLACLVALSAGLARVVGFAVEGEVPGMHALWAALEIVGGAFAGFVFYRSKEGR